MATPGACTNLHEFMPHDAVEGLCPICLFAAYLEDTVDFEPGPAGWPSIPGYRIERELGGGGMGVVYLASRVDETGAVVQTVALKAVRPELLGSRQHRLAHENDIRIAAGLRHERIVPILEVGPAEGPPCFTMPFMEGGSLKERIAATPLPTEDAVELLLDIVRAVDYLHGQGIVHRDLKPGNVLLDAAGRAYVADFGLARLLPPDGKTYVSQGLGGTLPYTAPEQTAGRVSKSCDVYGLGAILYEMLTGRAPFRGATPLETLDQVLNQDPVPPRLLNRSVDPRLQFICLKCLEKDPRYRYQSAADLAADLKRYLAKEGIPMPSLWEWFRRQATSGGQFEQPALWSWIANTFAAYTLLAHTTFYLLLRTDPAAWACWLWFFLFEAFGWLVPWAILRSRPRLDATERGLLSNWIAAVLCDAILFSLFCPPFGSASAGTVVWVYPAWIAVHGLMWVMEARLYWGRFYVLGLAYFAASLLMPLCIQVAPLLFGLVNGAGLLWLGLGLRRRAAERTKVLA
jgi:serine/threonine protein kinase